MPVPAMGDTLLVAEVPGECTISWPGGALVSGTRASKQGLLWPLASGAGRAKLQNGNRGVTSLGDS